MAREKNFLLGQGERLTKPIQVPKSGGVKNPPYDFGTAQRRISAKLRALDNSISELPSSACPRGEAVAIVTLHPRYLSKSDYPDDLFRKVGLRAIGSRSRTIKPEQWGIEKHSAEALTEDIFVAGSKSAFHHWSSTVNEWTVKTAGANEITYIEDISAFEATAKLRQIPEGDQVLLEVVLHNSNREDIVLAFFKYVKDLGATPLADRRREVRGLTFIPVRATPSSAEAIAQFSFVRVARGMPTLRPFRPTITRGTVEFPVELPVVGPFDESLRAVIFDGGLPENTREPLRPWVSYFETANIGPSVPTFEEHGLAVTSAFILGPLKEGLDPDRPICHVDHVRVLDERTGLGGDPDYYDVLDRIVCFLDQEPGRYSLVNISLGPAMAVDDDEVTLWTAELDKRFTNGQSVVTVAAGNDGERDAASGLNRIQPPADGVNVLSVGAADRLGDKWSRASYSCVGPGRQPGVVKPDGLAFGGSLLEPFGVLTRGLEGGPITGTSFAAPFALRTAASAMAQLGTDISPLAIRALLIHRAECDETATRAEVGWGRFEVDPLRLITCEDHEALVIYQGVLPVSEHLRASVPIRDVELLGMVEISATLVIAPEVDPEHSSTYTRSGLEVSFRPHKDKFRKTDDGRRPAHPQTKPFFSERNLYGESEYILREGGQKWEPCLRNSITSRAASLLEPDFDIYYHNREGGMKAQDPQPIPFAFILGIKAPKVPDLYNQILRLYSNVLIPIRPRLQLRVQS